jgi:glyoxylase-like metal-dependent hydrolase (beta-lactamase superfamily II)
MGVSAYLIRGILIDTGFRRAGTALLAAVQARAVRGVIVTHWHEDHAGNAATLAAGGIPIAMRDETREILRSRPAIQLYRRVVWGRPPALGERVEPFDAHGLRTIHTPGHSTDHQVVWDPETGTLFSGDLWLGVRARILHASENPYRIIESLRIVRALDPGRMFDAHRGIVERPTEAIDAKIEWLSETLDAIERAVRSGMSDREIVREVLGGEDFVAVLSRGDYSTRNLVRAVKQKLAAGSG